MFKMFKRSYALYWVLAISGAIAIYYAMWQKYPESMLVLLAIPLISVWVFVSAVIAQCYFVKLHEKITDILTKECNPGNYIAFYEKILKRKSLGKFKSYVVLNLCTGYAISGDVEKEKCLLDSIRFFPDTRRGVADKVCYFNNLAAYYININNIEEAENALENMKLTLHEPKLYKSIYESFYSLYTSKTFALNLVKGNCAGVEEFFNIAFDKEKNKLGKVAAKYRLGILYTHLGETKKAAIAFEYVLQNGNKTYYVQKANEYLGRNPGKGC